MPKSKTILIVDDEPDILDFIGYNLEKGGYKVHCFDNAYDVLDQLDDLDPDLIVLDIMMPKMDGIELCRRIRSKENHENTLIVFLTARGEDMTQISALESGGDDFIQKPIRPKVFQSRIKALLRRGKKDEEKKKILKFDDLEINKVEMRVKIGKKKIDLVKKEFQLLYLMAQKPGKVFSREEILKSVWGSDIIVGDRTIDVHVRKLREKLGPDYIRTVKGVGYKFEF